MIDCQICNFKAKNIDELSQHVGSLHNKMFQCKNCRFEATNEMMLREHTREVHQRKNQQKSFTCDQCRFDTIMENNLIEHKKNKHIQRNSQASNLKNGTFKEDSLCIFWNHGFCKNGFSCEFLHEEIKACYYQNNCRKFQCSLYHFDKSLNNVLGRSQVRGSTQNH